MHHSKKDYSQVENTEGSSQQSQEWMSQEIHPKVRRCNAEKL